MTIYPRRLSGGIFLFHVVEGADSGAEFVGEGWFGVACEEFSVDDFAELGEPVA